MELYAQLDDNTRVLSVGMYLEPPTNCPAVPDIPRKADGTPDDPRRYRWDVETAAYVLVPEWAAEIDAELAAASTTIPTETERLAAVEAAMLELVLGGGDSV